MDNHTETHCPVETNHAIKTMCEKNTEQNQKILKSKKNYKRKGQKGSEEEDISESEEPKMISKPNLNIT